MPKYRSITLSIMSQWEMKQFPEFPHPDSAHFRHQGHPVVEAGSETRHFALTQELSLPSGKTRNIPGWASSVSCYIPSIPGVRFFLKYTIEPPHPEGQLFYFKLYMNGRHISSWGVNPMTNPKGQVLRALFDADGKQGSAESGRKFLRDGNIESRPFIFTPEIAGRSAADDGGLIEVRVFRARGRKRKAPDLEQFRPQEQYGINLPSAGLLDKPQDTRYYDWILLDPKDEPYAAFLFHYRSWEHLQSLQLIPPSHPRSLLKPSNSFAFLTQSENSETSPAEGHSDNLSTEGNGSSVLRDERHSWNITALKQPLIGAFSQTINRPLGIGRCKEALTSSALSLEVRCKQLEPVPSAFSVPTAVLDKWETERPLPKLPKAKSSFDHSRKSSTCSNTPSITPSLASWIDRDCENTSPEPIVGVAAVVPVLRSSSTSDGSVLSARRSPSDWNCYGEAAPLSALRKPTASFIPPPEALFPPKTIMIQKPRSESATKCPTTNNLVIIDTDIEGNPHSRNCYSPPEGEWLSSQHTPSPIQRDLQHLIPETRNRQQGGLPEGDARLAEKNDLQNQIWYKNQDTKNNAVGQGHIQRSPTPKEPPAVQLLIDEVIYDMGNWI